MNSDISENHPKVVLDTNILISAIGFGGKPRVALLLAIEGKIKGITSRVLLAELHEVISKKFPKLEPQLLIIEEQIKEKFIIVQPKKAINLSRDEDDNRVLEAAWEGSCDYIITGDEDLINLRKFKNIKIVTPDEFLKEISLT